MEPASRFESTALRSGHLAATFLIEKSLEHYDQAEYDRQLQQGAPPIT